MDADLKSRAESIHRAWTDMLRTVAELRQSTDPAVLLDMMRTRSEETLGEYERLLDDVNRIADGDFVIPQLVA